MPRRGRPRGCQQGTVEGRTTVPGMRACRACGSPHLDRATHATACERGGRRTVVGLVGRVAPSPSGCGHGKRCAATRAVPYRDRRKAAAWSAAGGVTARWRAEPSGVPGGPLGRNGGVTAPAIVVGRGVPQGERRAQRRGRHGRGRGAHGEGPPDRPDGRAAGPGRRTRLRRPAPGRQSDRGSPRVAVPGGRHRFTRPRGPRGHGLSADALTSRMRARRELPP